MRLGAIKCNHFVLITYCEQSERMRRLGYENSFSSWAVQKTNTFGLENNRFSRWKLVKISISTICARMCRTCQLNCTMRIMMIAAAFAAAACRCLLSLLPTHCQWNRENKQKQRTNERTLHFVVIESSCYCLNYFLFCRFEVLVWSKVKCEWCSWETATTTSAQRQRRKITFAGVWNDL